MPDDEADIPTDSICPNCEQPFLIFHDQEFECKTCGFSGILGTVHHPIDPFRNCFICSAPTTYLNICAFDSFDVDFSFFLCADHLTLPEGWIEPLNLSKSIVDFL